jgi:hypothetical protein
MMGLQSVNGGKSAGTVRQAPEESDDMKGLRAVREQVLDDADVR